MDIVFRSFPSLKSYMRKSDNKQQKNTYYKWYSRNYDLQTFAATTFLEHP